MTKIITTKYGKYKRKKFGSEYYEANIKQTFTRKSDAVKYANRYRKEESSKARVVKEGKEYLVYMGDYTRKAVLEMRKARKKRK